jgi:signal transduction histidine kinase
MAGSSAGPAAAVRRRLVALAGGIRGRILFSLVILLAVTVAISIVAVRQVLVVQLAADIDTSLVQEVEELRLVAAGAIPATGDPVADARAAIDAFFEQSVPREYEAFLAFVDGEPYKRTVAPISLFDDVALASAWREIAEPTWGHAATAAGPVRWLAVPLTTSGEVGGVFVIAHFAADQQRQIDLATQVMAVVFLVVLLVASLLAWAAAGQAIRPLRALTATARSIGDRDLAARIPVEGTDEVAELAATLNSMLGRLEDAFAGQRAFLDDVGHELRTPLTVVRGHLELLDDDPVERRKTLDLVLDELDRMSRHVDELLLLARAERPDVLRPRPVELRELLEGVLARVRPLGDRDWRIDPPVDAAIVADPDRLTQALVNLADNAVRHTPERGVIELGARIVEGEARLWVRDEGAGIAPEDQERVFERFARGRDRRTRETEGSGLGLAIVAAIARAHGGRVELASAPGAGSTFTLVIPVEPLLEEGES